MGVVLGFSNCVIEGIIVLKHKNDLKLSLENRNSPRFPSHGKRLDNTIDISYNVIGDLTVCPVFSLMPVKEDMFSKFFLIRIWTSHILF